MADAGPTALQFAGFTLDPGARALVDAEGQEVALRRSEYELLAALLAAPGRALSRDHLLEAVAGRRSEPFDRSVDVLVGRLRRKIEPDPREPRLIVTVPGVGYRFAAKTRPVSAASEAAPVGAPVPPTCPERRQLTVMQCGLCGPALSSARRDPEDLQHLLAAFHEHARSVLAEAGGTVDRLLSDGLVAYFGYPQADEHQAERAIRAALRLVETTGRIDTGQPGPLHLRVGVASGLAVVGGQATTLGEAASVAAGLAAAAEPDSVLVSASTRRLVGELFELRPCEPAEAWCVTAESVAESRFEALRGAKLDPWSGAGRSWSCCSGAGSRPRPGAAGSCWSAASPESASRASFVPFRTPSRGNPMSRCGSSARHTTGTARFIRKSRNSNTRPVSIATTPTRPGSPSSTRCSPSPTRRTRRWR